MLYPLTLSLCFFLIATGIANAQSPTYTFQQLQYGLASSINDRGQILLQYSDYSRPAAYLYDETAGSYLLVSMGSSSQSQIQPVAFNSLDQVIGIGETYSNNGAEFWIQNGFNQLANGAFFFAQGGVTAGPTAINDAGVIVGYSQAHPGNLVVGALLMPGSIQPIELIFPGAIETLPAGINDANTVVGNYTDAIGNSHGFVYSNGSYAKLDVPQTKITTIGGINNIGEIVGNYVGLLGVKRGFVYSAGKFTTINLPANLAPFGLISLVGINDQGQIVGNAGQTPFLATPSYFTGF